MFLAVLNFTTVPISNSPPASRTMDFPAALFGRLQNHQQINKILADTISIVKNENIPEELFQRGLHTRIKNIWEFPEGRAQTWLECLGPDTLDARFDQACKDCHFIIVQIGGDNGAQPWVDGNIYLFPLVESFLGSAKDGRIVHTLFTPNPLMERIGVTRLPGVNHDQLAIEEFKEALQMDSPMALEMIGVVLELVHKTMSIVIATAGASDSNTAPEPVPQSGPASNEFVIEMEPAVYGARAEQKL